MRLKAALDPWGRASKPLLRQTLAALSGAFVLSAPATGNSNVVSDILGFPVKALLGSTIDKAQGSIDASVTKALDATDLKLRDHEGRISDLATALVDHTNDSLSARITEVTTNFKGIINTDLRNTVDHAISQVGGVGAALIDRLDNKATKLIDNVDDKLQKRLADVNEILENRSNDINKMLDDRVAQANQAIKERVVQIDEVARGRLGDVNAIASQQRIALEGMLARIAVLIGGVVFLVFVMQSLLKRYEDLKLADAPQRGARRTAFLARQLAPALAGPLLAAFAGLVLIAALYRWLPAGALQAGEDLVMQHRNALTDSVNRIDPARARFEAAHLSYLDPENTAHYAGLANKVGLIRDVIVMPGLLASEASRADFRTRLSDAERALGPRPDPDLLTLRALERWKTGTTREAEHEAASLSARALLLAPRGFGLAPLARGYVETFLHQPLISKNAEEGRDTANLEELSAALALSAPEPAHSPFAGITELSRLMRSLEANSTQSYVALALANARAVVLARRSQKQKGSPKSTDPVLENELALRTRSANDVVSAWKTFDQQIQASSQVSGPLLLNVFGLNDALFTRALWFVNHPTDTATHGTALRALKEPAERFQLAPARVAWSLRYSELMSGPMRAVLEAEEAKQFENWERWAIEFEDALIALEMAKDAKQDENVPRWRAAVAAAALGLYVTMPLVPAPSATENSEHTYRVPYARELAQQLDKSPEPPSKATLARDSKAPSGPAVVVDAPSDLAELLEVRGQRLM